MRTANETVAGQQTVRKFREAIAKGKGPATYEQGWIENLLASVARQTIENCIVIVGASDSTSDATAKLHTLLAHEPDAPVGGKEEA